MTDAWQGHETIAKLQTSSSTTITSLAALDTFFSSGTAVTGILKDYSVTKPKFDPSIIKLAGKDSNSKPNAAMESNTPDLAEFSGTFILPKDTLVDSILYGAGVAVAGTHTRFNVGKVPVQQVSILINIEDGSSNEFNVVFDNSIISTDDVNLTAADGHYEWSLSGKCLPADFYGPEYKD